MHCHLLILQPSGYIHSLGFIESARLLKFHFSRLGWHCTTGKNRPEHGALNIIFGAHIQFPTYWGHDYCCVIFNQEQLGEGGSHWSEAYVDLLRHSHVLEYDQGNFAAYAPAVGVEKLRAIAPLLNAPYLFKPDLQIPVRERPVELLFIGGINDSRASLISRIEKCGVPVSRFDHAMYGPERDKFIQQSRAILNIPFYASTRFERTRVFNALSLGTPVVSLRRPDLVVDAAFDQSVHWFADEQLEDYFTTQFQTDDWYQLSDHHLQRWRQQDAGPAYAVLAQQLEGVWNRWCSERSSVQTVHGSPQDLVAQETYVLIDRLNLSPQHGYKPGWTNAAQPGQACVHDVVLDWYSLSQADRISLGTLNGGHAVLHAGQLSVAYLYWSETGPPPRHLAQGLTRFLQPGGILILDRTVGVFHESSPAIETFRTLMEAQLRAAHEHLLRSIEGPMTLEWQGLEWLQDQACIGGGAMQLARITLRCREWTPREMVIRRTIRDDFGELPLDD